uniref:NADH-ubiquinone oxidoreductase chain 6 n=1 Tax=Acisoma panorpoides TaxID=342762 RepID=A0A4Y5SF42_ACIPA|nr:NADH dehydrogenase subunit 6 [Acisoma panorpoides]QDA21646.1 NADH dehydrogenase subunit 6 [Acisoma panorpoides]
MSQILSAAFIVMNSLMFSFMVHPMNMGIMLLLQTLMLCVLISLMSYNSWFSYILFLVFLGGMLVLFIYMTSIASNELFKKSLYIPIIMYLMIIMLVSLMLMMDPSLSIKMITESTINSETSKMIMAPLYNNPSSLITIFMVLYLFLTLIVVVSITSFNKGPLRPMN